MAIKDGGWVGNLVSGVVAALLTFGGSYFTLKSTQANIEPAYVEVLQREIRELKSNSNRQQAQILELTLKNADLTRMVGGDAKTVQLEGIFHYIDALERPAWCKEIEHNPNSGRVEFRMRYLNYEYELVYGVSIRKYIGGTDFDNHPRETAEAYYENDMNTYRSKDYREFEEPVSENENPDIKRMFAKFYVDLPTGPKLICGIQINGLAD